MSDSLFGASLSLLPITPADSKETRLHRCNTLLETIAGCGRRFFFHKDKCSHFELDHRGRIWFVDSYTGKKIFLHHPRCKWRGFTEGGTLKAVVQSLGLYIQHEFKLSPRYFGPWPKWICGGDLWGYGDDMQLIRGKAEELGIADRTEASDAAS